MTYAIDVSTEKRERTIVSDTLEGYEENESYALSENQARFVADAEDSGLEVDFWYSGRGMYGKYCPAVKVAQANDIATKANVREDSLGRGVVVYAQY